MFHLPPNHTLDSFPFRHAICSGEPEQFVSVPNSASISFGVCFVRRAFRSVHVSFLEQFVRRAFRSARISFGGRVSCGDDCGGGDGVEHRLK